jgi:hypothetical protein
MSPGTLVCTVLPGSVLLGRVSGTLVEGVVLGVVPTVPAAAVWEGVVTDTDVGVVTAVTGVVVIGAVATGDVVIGVVAAGAVATGASIAGRAAVVGALGTRTVRPPHRASSACSGSSQLPRTSLPAPLSSSVGAGCMAANAGTAKPTAAPPAAIQIR